jgi:hypothetical protein
MALFGGNPYREGYDAGTEDAKAGKPRRHKPPLMTAVVRGESFTKDWQRGYNDGYRDGTREAARRR